MSWLAVPRDLDHLAAGIDTIRHAAETAGRDPSAIGVASSGATRSLQELLDALPRLEQLGVTIVNLPALFWSSSVGEALDLMEDFAQRADLEPQTNTDEHG